MLRVLREMEINDMLASTALPQLNSSRMRQTIVSIPSGAIESATNKTTFKLFNLLKNKYKRKTIRKSPLDSLLVF